MVLAAIVAAAAFGFYSEPDKLALVRDGRNGFQAAQFCESALDVQICADGYQKVRLFAQAIAEELPNNEFARCEAVGVADVNAIWSCLTDIHGKQIALSYQRPF